MAVKIRMKRFGRRNRPYYRINAVDSRAARDGRVIEELGSYDPHAADAEKVRLNLERVEYWLSVGAQPSETVRSLLKTLPKGGAKPASAAPAARSAAAPAAPATPVAPAEPKAAAPAPTADGEPAAE